MLDFVISNLGYIFLGLCTGVCALAYWLDARRRNLPNRRKGVLHQAKMRPLSRSDTVKRD